MYKYSVICNLFGIPAHGSGPHRGSRSDSTLFREYHIPALDKFFREKGIEKPPQGKLILGLGDGAYQACPYVIYPYRKDHKWGDLEVDYTAIHAWYRARVEHTFGIL